jgi:hypothetical protein
VTTVEDGRMEFVINHEAYYWPALGRTHSREVTVTKAAYTPAGEYDGVHWEFTAVERASSAGRPLGVWVEVAHDAWAAYRDVPEFFAELAKVARDGIERNDTLRIEYVIDVCKRLGWVDVTRRDQPGGPRPPTCPTCKQPLR